MVFKKADPFKTDKYTRPLTDKELVKTRPASEVLNELGLAVPRPRGRPPLKRTKERITIRLDADILEHFRNSGRGWQGKINKILRDGINKKTG